MTRADQPSERRARMKMAWVGAVAVIALVVVFGLWHQFGPAQITVVAPRDKGVRVYVDGKANEDLEPREVKQLLLGPGEHLIRVGEAGDALRVQIKSGGRNQVVPAKDECFGVFDITGVAYQHINVADALQAPITVLSRHDPSAPFEPPEGAYFRMGDLPPQVPQGDRVEMVREVPCDKLEAGDDALLIYAIERD